MQRSLAAGVAAVKSRFDQGSSLSLSNSDLSYLQHGHKIISQGYCVMKVSQGLAHCKAGIDLRGKMRGTELVSGK